jgi:hypothetical protein
LQYNRALRARYGLPQKLQPGIMIIFGYPAVHYKHAIRRRFARVDFV